MKTSRKRMQLTVWFVLGMGMVSLMWCGSSVSAETLRILTWEGYTPDEHMQRFTELVKRKYGVDLTLEIQYADSNAEFFPAVRDNTADIITPSHNVPRDNRYQLIKRRMVLPLNLDNIPNYQNVNPGLQKADYCTEGDEVYCVPVAQGPYGLAYNTALVKTPPESWNILWDPRYADQYTYGEEQPEENIYITALAMGMPWDDISNYRKLNTPEFQEKLAQFVANAHSTWKGTDTPEDLQGLALAVVWGDSLNALREMGEIWEMAEPKEGTTTWIDNFMIGYALEEKPQLKQIAEEWLNYVLSDEYQLYNTREIGVVPVTMTVKAQLTSEEIANLHLDDPGHFKKYRILWPTLTKTDRKGLERLWNKATTMAE